MAVEQMRGCGYRKVGGLYLCGGGQGMDCDRLPYELEICPVCGAGVKFTRGWTWLDWEKYAGGHSGGELLAASDCKCAVVCPVCSPRIQPQPYGLLWVGEANYTPLSFIQEALTMGVSRRIAAVPKNLKLGETWVLFAHKHVVRKIVPDEETGEPVDIHVPGVFYAFRPQSLELLVWQSEAKPEYLEDLAKRNITPIIIPDGDEDHHPDTKTKISADDRAAIYSAHTIMALRNKIGR